MQKDAQTQYFMYKNTERNDWCWFEDGVRRTIGGDRTSQRTKTLFRQPSRLTFKSTSFLYLLLYKNKGKNPIKYVLVKGGTVYANIND